MKQLFTTVLVSLFCISSYSLTITGQEIWTTNRTINETLEIAPGAKLTISGCTIKVAENININLSGGELILNSALITSVGESLWRELKLFNNASLTMNNATLKNSLYGIGNSGARCTVKIENSTFIDCDRPLRLDITDFEGSGSYIRNNTIYTGTVAGFQFVHAKNLILEENTFYSDYTNQGYQCIFINCTGIILKDNRYICVNNNNVNTEAGGIKIDNSQINFLSSTRYIKNKFDGFSTAIDIVRLRDNNNPLIIKDVEFNKIRRYGIKYENTGAAVGNLKIYNNNFNLFTNNGIGVYLTNLYTYSISNNSFIGSDINNYNSGVHIEASALINSPQIISNNDFPNLHYAVFLKGYHHHAQIRCNYFSRDYYSILIDKYDEYDNNQGLGDQGNFNASANNVFLKHGENQSSIYNKAKRFTYYYNALTDYYPTLEARTVTLEEGTFIDCNNSSTRFSENVNLTNEVKEMEPLEFSMQVTPNPGDGTITIYLSDSVISQQGKKTIRVYDVLNRLVHSQSVDGKNQRILINNTFSKGNYHCVLSDNQEVIARVTAIVR